MHESRFHFNRGAIRPFQCIVGGWQLIKSDYWFFLGVTFVGLLVAELAPLGILLGPAMCGIHICLLRQANGQRVSFDMLFQGFNYFGPGFLATICIMVPTLLLVAVYYVFTFGGMFGIITWFDQQRMAGQQAGPEPLWIFLGWIAFCTLVLLFFVTLLQAVFLFVFPLIVDREMSGWEAVTTSFRAAMGNFGGVLMIVFLELMLGLIGVLMCYIGAFFLLPISFAMTAMAYRQVFPLHDPFANYELDPEPPAPKVLTDDTRVQSMEPKSTGVQDQSPKDQTAS